MKTSSSRLIMTVTPHDAIEWSRMAFAIAKTHPKLSRKLLEYASQAEISINEYDAIHSKFCEWLAFGL